MLHQDGFKRISRAGHHVWWWACLSCPRWLRINGGRQKQRAQEKWSSNCEDYCFSTSITINITCNLLLLVSFMRTKNEFTFFLWGSSFSRAPANQYFHCGLFCGLFFFSNNQLLVWSVKKTQKHVHQWSTRPTMTSSNVLFSPKPKDYWITQTDR